MAAAWHRARVPPVGPPGYPGRAPPCVEMGGGDSTAIVPVFVSVVMSTAVCQLTRRWSLGGMKGVWEISIGQQAVDRLWAGHLHLPGVAILKCTRNALLIYLGLNVRAGRPG